MFYEVFVQTLEDVESGGASRSPTLRAPDSPSTPNISVTVCYFKRVAPDSLMCNIQQLLTGAPKSLTKQILSANQLPGIQDYLV